MDVEDCYNKNQEINNQFNPVVDLGLFEISTTACRIYKCDNGIGCPSKSMIECCIEECYSAS